MGVKLDLTGQKFGRLSALQVSEKTDKNKGIYWDFRCDCGNTTTRLGAQAVYGRKKGKTLSCGCYKSETLAKRSRTHGLSELPIYKIWQGIKDRCNNNKTPAYLYYGARGIKVCDRWMKFENFYADMGDRPEGMSLDRIDNDGDYCPENCRWATLEEQARNTRRVRKYTFEGQSKCIAEWASIANIHYQTLTTRLNNGWSIEKALRTPIKNQRRKK